MEQLKYKILDDQPLGEGRRDRHYATSGGDPLGFGPLAQRIAEVVLSAEPNLAIGVYGDWGAGKTSFMRMIERKVKDEEHVVTVWFNAWQHHHVPNPLVSLATTIQRRLEQRGDLPPTTFWQKTREILPEISSLSLAGMVSVDLARDQLDEVAQARAEYAAALAGLHELGRKLPGQQSEEIPRIVVFVDDLDRCSPEVSVRLLENIKLVFGQPGFIFVLGVMPEVIADHVARGLAMRDASGREYLDKIMQLCFRIPSPSVATTDALVRYLCGEMGNADLAEGVATFAKILTQSGGTIGTPRSIKRFLNEYALELEAWHQHPAVGDPTAADAAANLPRDPDIGCAQTLRYCWPGLFNLAAKRPSTVLLQLREAAGVAEDPLLLSRRLAEVAQSVDDESEARRIKEGLAFRAFLGLQDVSDFLHDFGRATLAIRGPGADLLQPAQRPELQTDEILMDELDDSGRRFMELSIQYRIEPSEKTARQCLKIIESDIKQLNRTEVGNLAVQVGKEHQEVARRMFEAMDGAGMLKDWRHAGQYVVFLLTRADDKETAIGVMDRFRAQVPFTDPKDQQRWEIAEALTGRSGDLSEFLERLRQNPGDGDAMFALQATLSAGMGVGGEITRQALEALALYTGESSDAEATRKVQMARATGDALARGSNETAGASAALFWSLKGTSLWGDVGTLNNLANVTFVDIDDDPLAIALWTVAYVTAGGRKEAQVQRPFSAALAREGQNQVALAAVQGDELPDEASRLQAALQLVEEQAWSRDKIREHLVAGGGEGPWDGLFAALDEEAQSPPMN